MSGLISIVGGLVLSGISVARAVVTRIIATRRRKLMGKVLTELRGTNKTK
jgi:hypothetical protein